MNNNCWKKSVNLNPFDIANILKNDIFFPIATIGRFRAKKGKAINNQINPMGTNKKPTAELNRPKRKIGKNNRWTCH